MTENQPSEDIDAWTDLWTSEVGKRVPQEVLKRKLPSGNPEEFIASVQKLGVIDLGNDVELISCAGCTKDAICLLFPLDTAGGDGSAGPRPVCSGPIYTSKAEKRRIRTLRWLLTGSKEPSQPRTTEISNGTHRVVAELPQKDCPYSFYYQNIDVDERVDQEGG